MSSAWWRAAVSRPALARYPSPGRPAAARQLLGQLTGPQGQCSPECGEVGTQILDLLIPRRSEPGPQELAPLRQLVVRLHAHATSLSGRWPLPDTVTWATSWLTLRRDRPNRSAIARWLSGAPAATDAAYAARTAWSTSPGKLTRALGRQITYVDAPDEAVRDALLGAGLSAWFADALVGLYQDYRRSGTDGYAAQVTDTVERLTGRPARSLDDLLAEIAPDFKATQGDPAGA